jgi:hypothetical protein
MMNTGDNKIDELFRKSLTEEEIEFDEAHWRDMKKKLEQDGKRRKEIFFWTSLGGVAAMFLMTMAWWFTQSVTSKPDKISKTKVEIKTQAKDNAAESALIPREEEIVKKQDFHTSVNNNRSGNSIQQKIEPRQPENIAVVKTVPQTSFGAPEKMDPVAESSNKTQQVEHTSSEQKNTIALQDNNMSPKADSSARVVVIIDHGFRPSIILSVTAAPDLSAVNSFSDTKRGLSGGLLATVTLSPRVSVTTGAQLARKVYETGYNNYRPVSNYVFPVAPSTVDADCRVLDIPVNLNYTVWNKGVNKIGLSAGASSYFMIKENYNFGYDYKKPGMRYPAHYEVRNQNKHVMGVGNIAVSYERKLNKNAGIAIQPFVKLPLTDIGFGNVKLMSTGVSANLNINISEIARRKP